MEDPAPPPEPTVPASASPIALALLERVLQDRRDGGQRSIDEYVAMFPDHERLVRAELDRLAAPAPATDAATAGFRIGRYRVLDTIGRGGQGTVYLAADDRLGRRVALKLLTGLGGCSAAAKLRFRREAEAASRLVHPGLCATLDAEEHEGVPFLVMQYIDGQPLLQFVDAVPAARRRAVLLALFERIARALHHAHEHGFVHRDVKPANVLVTAAGDPVVIDFGLVRSLDADGAGLTRSGELFGTPAYLAPEQIHAGSPLADRRVDVWALGVSLFEALTGRRPFVAPTYDALCRAITDEEPTDLRRAPNVGNDLAVVVATALTKEPAGRYATAAALADDLGRVQRGEPIHARPVTVWMRTQRWARRNRLLATFLVLVVLQLMAVAVVGTLFVQRGIQNREWERIADLRAVEHMLTEAETGLWPAVPAQLPAYDAWLARAERLLERLPDHGQRLAELRAMAEPATDDDRADPALDERLLELEADALFAERADSLRLRHEQMARALAELPADAAEWQRIDAMAWASVTENPMRWAQLAAEQRTANADEAAAIRARSIERRRWRFASEIEQSQHDQIERLITLVERIRGPGAHTIADLRDRRAHAAELLRRLAADDAPAWQRCCADVAQSDSPYRGLSLQPIPGLVPLGIDERSGLWEFWHVGSGARPTWVGEPAGRGRIELGGDGAEGIVLVLLPGGGFTMGSSRLGEDLPQAERRAQPLEWPPHTVTLAPFLIGKYEVTHAQWATHGQPDVAFLSPDVPSPAGIRIDRRHPVTQMTWQHAHEFCRRHDLELPTEAQWEYAQRAGTATPYPTGDDPKTVVGHANLLDAARVRLYPAAGRMGPADWQAQADDGFAETAPVGSFPPNAFGVHDLMGNAGEWCRDRLAFYEQRQPRAGDGQRGSLDANREAMARGSSFVHSAIYCRSAMRQIVNPTSTMPWLGLRVARSIDVDRASAR